MTICLRVIRNAWHFSYHRWFTMVLLSFVVVLLTP
ncbi:DUF3265 domain-containing protein [Vibrio cholerae]|nr:DUF3265 domain-containing protein [Vibrio cholerae]